MFGGKNLAPNLTTIYISEMKIVNDDPKSSTVKFDFPVLENLTLLRWMNVKSVEICAPSLTTFKSALWASSDCDDGFSITIDSSSLLVLNYEDCKMTTLEQSETIVLRVNNLVNGFTSLEELDVTRFAAKLE